MGEHAKYSPSQISRIIRCPGSVDFVRYLVQKSEIPAEETTTYADEGTMLHEQIARAMMGQTFNAALKPEQRETLETCANWFNDLVVKHGLTWKKIESKVSLKHFGIKECYGTTDIITGQKKRTLHSIDWKFGQGVFVEGDKNEQLMTYLLGAAENPAKLEAYDELWIHLCQPRLENFNSYQCSVDELYGLANAIKNAQKSHDIVAGEKQCFWCRGKNRCAEYEVLVRGKAALVFQVNDLMKQNEYPFEQMAKVLLLEKDFTKIFKAIKDSLNELPSDKLAKLKLKRVAGRSVRQWADEETVIQHLVENYQDIEEIYTEPKLKSPAQIEGTIKGIKKDPEFQKLIVKPIGAPTLVSINDKRPEYKQDASAVFQKFLEK